MQLLEILRAKQKQLNAELNSRQPGTQPYEDRLTELSRVIDSIRELEKELLD